MPGQRHRLAMVAASSSEMQCVAVALRGATTCWRNGGGQDGIRHHRLFWEAVSQISSSQRPFRLARQSGPPAGHFLASSVSLYGVILPKSDTATNGRPPGFFPSIFSQLFSARASPPCIFTGLSMLIVARRCAAGGLRFYVYAAYCTQQTALCSLVSHGLAFAIFSVSWLCLAKKEIHVIAISQHPLTSNYPKYCQEGLGS